MGKVPNFVPCRKCMGVKHPFIKNFMMVPKGFYETTIDDQRVVVECECHKKFMRDVRHFDVYEKSGIPFSFHDYDIDTQYRGDISRDNLKKLKTYVERFQEESFSSAILYLVGASGTQKTYVAKWLGGQVINAGKKVSLLTMLDLVAILMKASDGFTDKKDVSDEFLYVDSADLVIVDDAFDKDRINVWKSGYQLQFLDSFIRKRKTAGKGLVFVSRFPPEEIVQQGFSESIQATVSREVNLKKTLLKFEDSYESNMLNPKGLFEDD